MDSKVNKVLMLLVFGQSIALMLSLTGVFSTYLVNANAAVPCFQNFLNYCALLVVYGFATLVMRRRNPVDGKVARAPWYYYVGCSLADVSGNVLLVYAYQYTTITSVTALDCMTIPCVLMLSKLFLGTKYHILQYVGVLICLVGIGIVVASDVLAQNSDSGPTPNPVLGDMLVLLGAFMYAVTNVLQEKLVKDYHAVEYLAMMGLFGTLFSGILVLALERQLLSQIEWTSSIALYFLGYVAVMFTAYGLVSLFIKIFDALVFNLSLLTSDVYAIIFAYTLFQANLHWLYFVGFAIVSAGVVLYSVYARFEAPVIESEGVERGSCKNAEYGSFPAEVEII